MYGQEYGRKECWVPKNSAKAVVLRKTLESPLDSNRIKPVSPKWNQPSLFIWRTDTEAEAPILWLSDAKSQLTGKDPDAGKDRAVEGDDRGWDVWMAWPIQWPWIWANSRKWWRIGKPDVLQFIGVAKSQAWFNNWTTAILTVERAPYWFYQFKC